MDFAAARMKEIPFSSIRHVSERVAWLRAQGRSVVPFHIGEPDFDTPEHIKQAAKEALDNGLTSYTSNYGLPELRIAIAGKLKLENGVQTDPEEGVIVTVGSNEAVLMAMLATLNPGDEVLVPDPGWPHYLYCARLAGAKAVGVPLRAENRFRLDPDDLERLVTPKTRMLLINSPHNPTGVVFQRETIRAIARFVLSHNLILVSDEIYEKLVFDDAQPVSPASMPELGGRTITINGFSKAYAMTGWRIGYAAAAPPLVQAMIRVHQYTTVCANSFAQVGAVAALQGPQDGLKKMCQAYAERRRLLVAALEDLPGIEIIPPGGAFYAFVPVHALRRPSIEVASELLDQYSVAVVSGRAFGEYGEGFIRLSFACSRQQVQEGMQLFGKYWQQQLATGS